MAGPWCLGIEIGGTKLQLGLGRGRGEILALERRRVDPARQASGIREQIAGAFPGLLVRAGLDHDAIGAVGVGFGGPVDTDRGRIERSYQIEGWDDFPLADWIREALGIPAVVIHNDADTAGLAEARLGAGRGHAPLLYITVGSGIGGALILGDRIYRGFGKGAGEIGHLLVPTEDEGPDRGITLMELEQVASGWAIARAGQQLLESGGLDAEAVDGPAGLDPERPGQPVQVTGLMVARAAADGVPGAVRILGRAQSATAFALAQAIALVAPRRIVIGGGVSLIGDEWFDAIRRGVDRLVFPPFRGGWDIVPAALGEEVVIHGALSLALDALLQHSGVPPRDDSPSSAGDRASEKESWSTAENPP